MKALNPWTDPTHIRLQEEAHDAARALLEAEIARAEANLAVLRARLAAEVQSCVVFRARCHAFGLGLNNPEATKAQDLADRMSAESLRLVKRAGALSAEAVAVHAAGLGGLVRAEREARAAVTESLKRLNSSASVATGGAK